MTKKSAIFLALTFAWSWGVVLFGYYGIGREALGPFGTIAVLVAMMAGPAVAAIICAMTFEKGRRAEALGLKRFKPNLWWLLAWVIPIAVSYASIAITLLLTDQHYVDMGENARNALQAQGQDISQVPPLLLSTPFMVGLAVTLGALINTVVLTFTEELGWRGYLYDVGRPAGFWRLAVVSGLIWGFWHAPAIYLFGHNYPTEPVWGVVIFTFYCVPLSVIITHVRERADSVWAAGILHGTFNAVPGISIASLSAPVFPWTGIVGFGGIIALTIGAAMIAYIRLRSARAGAAAT